ncbi:hypothetical protein TCSYLVIO_003216 [Trypanosoma cruzi]|nr:hypothetical protein TCSYLVIO_003216 [Trypanosoma cruzi]
MEEFYNNPFRHDPAVDDVCYASVQFPSMTASNTETESCRERDFLSISSALRFQTQLSEALRANSTLRSTYEAHIETQRNEIDRLSVENNELQMKLTRLEAQLRSLLLEKDCSTMAYKREIEKNALLEEKVGCLEEELNSLERRTRELRAAYNRTPQQTDGCETTFSRTRPNLLQQQRENHYTEQGTPSSLVSASDLHSPKSLLESERNNRSGERQKWRAAEEAAASWRTETTTSVKTGLGGRTPKPCSKVTPYPTQVMDEENDVVVKELEKRLLRECQTRDEIEKRLQKMESTRIRSGSERAKKIALEREFIAAQRAVGETRMRLRELSALVR